MIRPIRHYVETCEVGIGGLRQVAQPSFSFRQRVPEAPKSKVGCIKPPTEAEKKKTEDQSSLFEMVISSFACPELPTEVMCSTSGHDVKDQRTMHPFRWEMNMGRYASSLMPIIEGAIKLRVRYYSSIL